MKKASDPRHKHRQYLVKQLFARSYNTSTNLTPKLQQIIDCQSQSDKLISQNAPEWPIEQINRVDLAILRLAVYELNQTQTPPKVIIDEAVELAKEFGSNSSAKFVNGVLGNILKSIKQDS